MERAWRSRISGSAENRLSDAASSRVTLSWVSTTWCRTDCGSIASVTGASCRWTLTASIWLPASAVILLLPARAAESADLAGTRVLYGAAHERVNLSLQHNPAFEHRAKLRLPSFSAQMMIKYFATSNASFRLSPPRSSRARLDARHHAGSRVDAAILDVNFVGLEARLRKGRGKARDIHPMRRDGVVVNI